MTAVVESQLCADCGEPLTPEEIAEPVSDGDGVICCGCEYKNRCWACDICEDYESNDYDGDYFVNFDADDAGVPVGVYRILKRPFYMQSIIGGGRVWANAVERVADVPAEWHEGSAPCSMLCRDCAAPYAAMVSTQPEVVEGMEKDAREL